MRDSPWLAKLGLVLVFGALLMKCLSLVLQIMVDRRFFPGLSTGDGFVNFSSGLAVTANVLVVGSVLVASVSFIYWFHSAYQALADIDAAVHKPLWAVIGWFVPGISLVRPPQIMGELTNQFSAGRRPKRARWTRQLWTWWGLWLLGTTIHLLLRLDLPNTRRGWFYWETVALLATLMLIVSLVACWGLVDRAVRKQAGITSAPPLLRRKTTTDDVSKISESA